MEIFDLIVIGGGPAGYLGAERAAAAGLSTLLIEKNMIGGVCLNEGCIPSKTLLYSAKLLDNAVYGEKYGVTAGNIRFDHKAVISRKNKVVKKLVTGIKSKLASLNVTVAEGSAYIEKKSADGYAVTAGDKTYTGRRLLIATGSQPVIPGIPGAREGLDKGYVLTNREILDLDEVPEKLVVVGGGIIGLEMASYYNSAGSRVTVIEMLDHIGGQTDREVSNILRKGYEKKGVVFSLDSKVVDISDKGVEFGHNGGRSFIEADKVLLSIGRQASVKGLGLENIGVELHMNAIKTDLHCRTNVPEVYAAGDVNGKSMLAHTAYRESEVAVSNMGGIRDIIRYHTVPSVIYTNPEVACIGETEETAAAKGMNYQLTKLSMMFSGRYAAENEGGDGIFKLLTDKETSKIIGAHMIGNPASEIIYGIGIMMENEMRIKDIKELVFPHPTVSEIIREAIFNIR